MQNGNAQGATRCANAYIVGRLGGQNLDLWGTRAKGLSNAELNRVIGGVFGADSIGELDVLFS
jgi:hypothetical protein